MYERKGEETKDEWKENQNEWKETKIVFVIC